MSDKPPRDIAPAQFFTDWLPRFFAAHAAARPSSAPSMLSDIRVRVRLDGEGGGAWDLEVREGRLAVATAGGIEPPVTVTQSVADWRAVAVGEEGAVDLAPPQSSPLDLLFLDPAARQMLATIKGAIRFEVTGYNGRTWNMTVKFGDQPAPASPDATITVDADTYAKIRARTMQPPEAFFQGKLKLSGNTGLAMQLGMAMMPRFQ